MFGCNLILFKPLMLTHVMHFMKAATTLSSFQLSINTFGCGMNENIAKGNKIPLFMDVAYWEIKADLN